MIVNSFFHGKKLDLLNLLTVKSFVKNNIFFNLYTYSKNITDFNDTLFSINDANEILDKKHMFKYKGLGDCPVNSIAGFSDIFRFHLLQKRPGWYVDMDVTCLRDFNDIDNNDIVFRPSKNWGTVANIIKCNNQNFISKIIEEYESNITANNDLWVKPLNILTEQIKNFNLQNFIVDKKYFGNDDPLDLMNFLEKNIYEIDSLPSHALHWCNTACTTSNWNIRLKINWQEPRLASLYYCLLKKYDLVK